MTVVFGLLKQSVLVSKQGKSLQYSGYHIAMISWGKYVAKLINSLSRSRRSTSEFLAVVDIFRVFQLSYFNNILIVFSAMSLNHIIF